MDDNKVVIGTILTTILLVVGGVIAANFLQSASPVELDERVKAEVGVMEHDWGEIGIDDGEVETVFEIKNEGLSPLQLHDVITSCMCTTAQLVLGDKTSPAFGMHSKSNYVMEVPAGETARLIVVFDPAFHGPNGVGAISLQIEVQTNDSSMPTISFEAEAVVVASAGGE